MFRLHGTIKLFVLLFAGLMIFNCTPRYALKTEESTSSYPALLPEDFPKEIARLERVAQYHPDSSVRTKTHLQLALLYSHYKNPTPDYLRALEELETYISLDPDGNKGDEIQNWLAVLRKLNKVTGENKRMKRSIKSLTEQNQNLTEENQKMKETIEELKHLDIQLEEKRKNIK